MKSDREARKPINLLAWAASIVYCDNIMVRNNNDNESNV